MDNTYTDLTCTLHFYLTCKVYRYLRELKVLYLFHTISIGFNLAVATAHHMWETYEMPGSWKVNSSKGWL